MAAPENRIRDAIAFYRGEACAAFISVLELKGSHSLAAELKSSIPDYDLVAEVIRSRILSPKEIASAIEVRAVVGWQDSQGFTKLLPEFWDLVSLLPFREEGLTRALTSLLSEEDGGGECEFLDAGCGTGIVAALLFKGGYRGRVRGCDVHPGWLAYAGSRGLEHFSVENRNITTINEKDRFDGVCCYMVLHHTSDEGWQVTIENLFSALKPGGIFSYTDIVSRLDVGSDPLTVGAPECREPLESGQLLHISPIRLLAREHLKPHPQASTENFREWRTIADQLSSAGFAIERMDVIDEVTVHFKCRKPDTRLWVEFASMENRESFQVLDDLTACDGDGPRIFRTRSPYQFTLPVMAALWHDLMGSKSPFYSKKGPWWKKTEAGWSVNLNPMSSWSLADDDEIRAIAFFSWERDSRQFLVRRAWPHHFHIISYSSVFAGWGSLGRMLEELEANGELYLSKKGYSFLDREDLQRTLPFAGDFKSLKYDAALAIPVAVREDGSRPELLGAFLVYLRSKRTIPVHTGSNEHKRLNEQFGELARKTVLLLQEQEKAFEYTPRTSREQATVEEWRRLVETSREGESLVIAEVVLAVEQVLDSKPEECARLLDVLSAGLRAMLSGPDMYAIKDVDYTGKISDRKKPQQVAEEKFTSCLLVAARPGMTYEALRDRILALIGPAGRRQSVRGLSFRCQRLRRISAAG